MKIKVCGLRLNEDIAAVANSGADYIGLIFYTASSRYAAGIADPNLMELIAKSNPKVKRVGVFVDMDADEVRFTAEKYYLNALQFHGDESPEYCAQFSNDYTVIKAFAIDEEFDFSQTEAYEGICETFLFDTSGPLPGGNGFSWDWSMLANYNGNTPFMVSGGIRQGDVLKVAQIRHPQFLGIDINSGFEVYPGVKNTEAIRLFVRIIKAGEYAVLGQ